MEWRRLYPPAHRRARRLWREFLAVAGNEKCYNPLDEAEEECPDDPDQNHDPLQRDPEWEARFD